MRVGLAVWLIRRLVTNSWKDKIFFEKTHFVAIVGKQVHKPITLSEITINNWFLVVHENIHIYRHENTLLVNDIRHPGPRLMFSFKIIFIQDAQIQCIESVVSQATCSYLFMYVVG